MRRTLSLLLLLLPAVFPCRGQNDPQAVALLDGFSRAYTQAKGVTLDFRVETMQDGTTSYAAAGSLVMQGDRFRLTTDDLAVWFDGTTQWALLEGTGEVNVTTPDAAELQAVNPWVLLQLYKNGFRCRLLSETTTSGNRTAEIELTPEKADNPLGRIRLRIDTERWAPLFASLENRDGSRTEIRVVKYRTGMNHPENSFVFDKKKYPVAELIDLR